MPRSLPARPNLAQLKQQAKDLLHAYRAGDPAARLFFTPPARAGQAVTLAAAQHALARDYGYASWPKLKQHVTTLLAKQAARAAQRARQQARRLAAQQRVQAITARMVAAVERGEVTHLTPTFAFAKYDLGPVRAALVASGHFTRVVDLLLHGVAEGNARTRFDCAQAMDQFADERCAAPLRQLLFDPVPRVRWAALHSLRCDACKLAPLPAGEDLVPVLIELALRDPSINVRRVATYELGQACPDARATAALAEVLAQTTDRRIRRSAPEALQQRA